MLLLFADPWWWKKKTKIDRVQELIIRCEIILCESFVETPLISFWIKECQMVIDKLEIELGLLFYVFVVFIY